MVYDVQKRRLHDVLQDVKSLLLTKGWCSGVFAKDAKGESCDVYSTEAACFCLYGAMKRVCGGNAYVERTFCVVADVLEERTGDDSLVEFNDNVAKSIDDVICLLDEAIERAEGGAEEVLVCPVLFP